MQASIIKTNKILIRFKILINSFQLNVYVVRFDGGNFIKGLISLSIGCVRDLVNCMMQCSEKATTNGTDLQFFLTLLRNVWAPYFFLTFTSFPKLQI